LTSAEDERRRVYTATEFVAAVEAGESVEFEIGHGYMLRSDLPAPPDFLKKRLENMVEAERALAERERET
jgi:hypothetical protein